MCLSLSRRRRRPVRRLRLLRRLPLVEDGGQQHQRRRRQAQQDDAQERVAVASGREAPPRERHALVEGERRERFQSEPRPRRIAAYRNGTRTSRPTEPHTRTDQTIRWSQPASRRFSVSTLQAGTEGKARPREGTDGPGREDRFENVMNRAGGRSRAGTAGRHRRDRGRRCPKSR